MEHIQHIVGMRQIFASTTETFNIIHIIKKYNDVPEYDINWRYACLRVTETTVN